MDDHRGERRSERRVHLSEAAALLGVSKDAVRMRIKRGTLRSEKGSDGRVYVWVNDVADGGPNPVRPESRDDAWRELVDELRDRVRSLEESNRENRRIIAALTQRIPEIEPPASPEPRESPEPAAAGPAEATTAEATPSEPVEEPSEALGGPGSATARGSWWRRMFGG